jgi:hypothetical protein
MLTALLILVVLIAVVCLVGGVAMMFDGSGGFFTWWCGWNAFRSGCEILACVVPAILEAIADASKS